MQQLFSPETETCPLSECTNRVLAEDVYADRDFPPFNRVAMDGICIRFEDFAAGQRVYQISGIQSAGEPQKTLIASNACLEVMTGAVLPSGSDTVIRYEDLLISDERATVQINDILKGQNVHPQGHDRRNGDLLLRASTTITPAEIGVLATVGNHTVKVLKLPRILVISTGDELVEVDQIPADHQIRKSNVFVLQSLLAKYGIKPDFLHLQDHYAEMLKELQQRQQDYDVYLCSGAVSKGKFDHLPDVLHSLGVKAHFHKVQQRPGKPFWFGTSEHLRVFAFPGNPVSTMVCAMRFLMPWLNKSYGLRAVQLQAKLTTEVMFKPALQYFVPVSCSFSDGNWHAKPVPGHGSGDLANLADAHGFIELPETESIHAAGRFYPLWLW